ncbi:MAG TPA: phenylalanine--tRNA ligase subunit alpha, partial [Thiotrichaceae bacterium]|nr:phenylalanine--tRNA ligase subunit alpha [Thiotrichaceae bacterium]
MNDTEKLQAEAIAEVEASVDLSSLDQIRVNYLGKKGLLTQQLKQLGKLPADERPQA